MHSSLWIVGNIVSIYESDRQVNSFWFLHSYWSLHLGCQCSQMIYIWSSRNYLPFYSVGRGGGTTYYISPFVVVGLIWRNSWISTNFSHVWLPILGCSTCSNGGGDYGITSGYRKDRLDPCCTKGKFLKITSGGVISTLLYQGMQERVVTQVRTWSPF